MIHVHGDRPDKSTRLRHLPQRSLRCPQPGSRGGRRRLVDNGSLELNLPVPTNGGDACRRRWTPGQARNGVMSKPSIGTSRPLSLSLSRRHASPTMYEAERTPTKGPDTMNRPVIRTAVGLLIVISGFAGPRAANAQSHPARTWGRWRNADTSRGVFYLSVWGGEVCQTGEACGLANNTQVVTYQLAGLDQRWGAVRDTQEFVFPEDNVQNYFQDYRNGVTPMCLVTGGNNSTAAGASIVVYDCQSLSQGPGQYWNVEPAEFYGAPYPGCFLFYNEHSGLVMSVRNGVVQNGSQVDQWPMCEPGSDACGNPSNAWHPDQFWCPE